MIGDSSRNLTFLAFYAVDSLLHLVFHALHHPFLTLSSSCQSTLTAPKGATIHHKLEFGFSSLGDFGQLTIGHRDCYGSVCADQMCATVRSDGR